MDSTHNRWLEECLERNTGKKILKAEKGRIGKQREKNKRERQSEHDRKEEPKRAPVRRGP
jgi:hypothetical protein